MSDDQFLPLTADERALLDDPVRAPSFVSIALTGRGIEAVRVQRLVWSSGSFAESRWRAVHFVDCTFTGVDFSTAVLGDVQFERCSFSNCRFEQTRFTTARFVDCTLEETFWREAELLDCSFERTTFSGAWFEASRLHLHMHAGSLSQLRLSACNVDVLQLTEVQVEGLRLSFCTTLRLVFQHCAVERLSLLGGTYESFLAYAGSLRDVKCGALVCQRAELEDVAQIDTFHINECTLSLLSLRACAQVDDLYVFKTDVQLLSIQGGRVAGWFTHSTSRPGSSIVETVLQDFFWDDSVCEGLTLRGVQLEAGLCARRTRFVDLRLIDLRYAPEVELVLDEAVFERSDLFLRTAP